MSQLQKSSRQTLFNFIIIFALGFAVSACSEKMTFSSSSVVPAAEGKVKIKNDNNGNSHIKLDVYNLASPEMLTPPKKEYVVWMKTGNDLKKIGRLNSSQGTFSKSWKGSLETVSTQEPSGFIITAEDNPDVISPGPVVVLQTK